MMLRDKKNTSEKRVIVDLSWPIGQSVNANIPFDTYEGKQANMSLPTAEELAQAILAAPHTAHMYSIDLSRAYRQLRIDPQEWPLLGLTWRGQYFFDRALAFGGTWHAAACQRVTNSLRHIMAKSTAKIWPYLDDIVGLADDLHTATRDFKHLRSLMTQFHLEEATHKAVEPTRQLTWIGIRFNLVDMTMSIPADKLTEAHGISNHSLVSSSVHPKSAPSTDRQAGTRV